MSNTIVICSGSKEIVLNDDSWSYTCCSSSKSGDTKTDTESLMMSDMEEKNDKDTGDCQGAKGKVSIGLKKVRLAGLF